MGSVKLPFALLENDGHNMPALHLFEDQAAAEEFLGLDAGAFDDEEEFTDGDATSWMVVDAEDPLPVTDHRK